MCFKGQAEDLLTGAFVNTDSVAKHTKGKAAAIYCLTDRPDFELRRIKIGCLKTNRVMSRFKPEASDDDKKFSKRLITRELFKSCTFCGEEGHSAWTCTNRGVYSLGPPTPTSFFSVPPAGLRCNIFPLLSTHLANDLPEHGFLRSQLKGALDTLLTSYPSEWNDLIVQIIGKRGLNFHTILQSLSKRWMAWSRYQVKGQAELQEEWNLFAVCGYKPTARAGE
ncbi:hypothetical protein QBC45DRAFT_458749 [Copromyces sp. CBS 386.78]|nr:hypothetical protein QBC45DRAFT_458749 [Copromyces sp. CBS 386.78]